VRIPIPTLRNFAKLCEKLCELCGKTTPAATIDPASHAFREHAHSHPRPDMPQSRLAHGAAIFENNFSVFEETIKIGTV
jgi:hypothetical protein